MKIIADTHSHSLLCDHAYSTIIENTQQAAKKGIRALCTTEHTPNMPGAPTMMYFGNISALPRQFEGVTLVRGAEVNIISSRGGLDLPDGLLQRLEWVIASLHIPCIDPTNKKDHTKAWLNIAKNPLIHVIGHCGDTRYDFDYETGIEAFAHYGKVVEINAHSFDVRPGSLENCTTIARLCKKHKVNIVVSSDSHFATSIGEVDVAIAMLEAMDFPEELILNTDYNRFGHYVNKINQTEIFTDLV